MANSESKLFSSITNLNTAFNLLSTTVKFLNDLFTTTTDLITAYSGQAAELVRLSQDGIIELEFLQKLKHAAKQLNLDFNVIKEDLPKLTDEFEDTAKLQGKSFEQFFLGLTDSDAGKNLNLSEDTIRMLAKGSTDLKSIFEQCATVSDLALEAAAELNNSKNSLLTSLENAFTKIMGKISPMATKDMENIKGVIDGSGDGIASAAEFIYQALRAPAYVANTKFDEQLHPIGDIKKDIPKLSPVELWKEVMQYSPRPYDFGDEYRENARQVPQMGGSIIGALSRFSEKLNQACSQLVPFTGVLQSLARQIPDLPPPTQEEIEAYRNKSNIFARGGIWQAKLDAIRMPNEGPAPWAGSTAAAGAVGAMGLSAAGGMGANQLRGLREVGIALAALCQTPAEQGLPPYNSILMSRSALAASDWGRSRGQGTVIHDNHTSNIYVNTSDPVRAGEVAAKAAAAPYATPGAYAPVAC